jgi:hypothetical protein
LQIRVLDYLKSVTATDDVIVVEESDIWQDLESELQIIYGKSNKLKTAVKEVHREKLCLFIAASNNETEKFAASLWLQKFDDEKKKKIVVPRPPPERKRSNQAFRYEPPTFVVKKRKVEPITLGKTSVDEVQGSDDDDDFEEDEDEELVVPKSSGASSTEYSKSKLTPVMIETWRQHFYIAFNKLYDYDPNEGEQNR